MKGNPKIIEALNKVLELEIGAILEPLYRDAGEWEKLHKIHEVQLSKLTEAADRQQMYQRLAEISFEDRQFLRSLNIKFDNEDV